MRSGWKLLNLLLVLAIVVVVVLAISTGVSAEEAGADFVGGIGTPSGGGWSAFAEYWLTRLLGLLLSAGLFELLRQKINEAKLVKNEVVNSVIRRAAMSGVNWVEKTISKKVAAGGDKPHPIEKRNMAMEVAADALAASGATVPPASVLASAVDAAWAEMSPPFDLAAASSMLKSATTPPKTGRKQK